MNLQKEQMKQQKEQMERQIDELRSEKKELIDLLKRRVGEASWFYGIFRKCD